MKLHLPTHDLFWANLKVQLRLPPLRSLDLLISPGTFDWLTHNDLCGSDHFPIILKTSPNEDEPAVEHWRLDRADWMSFRTQCASRLSGELALLEDPVAQFTDTLIEIANETILKSHNYKNKLPKVPWFNDAGKQAIKERKKAQRAENVLVFKQLKAKARYL